MEYLLPLAAIGLANLLGAMSPGPAFIIIARTAAEKSRRAGFAAVAGVTIGALVWAAAAIFGLALLFTQLAWLYRIVQIVGALYLIYLAVMVWRGARTPFTVNGAGAAGGAAQAFTKGLVLQLSNPKVVVFFGSIFVTLLPVHAPAWVWIATMVIVLINEAAWYSIVTMVFSTEATRRAYARAKLWLDRAMAGFLAAIGAKLLFDAR